MLSAIKELIRLTVSYGEIDRALAFSKIKLTKFCIKSLESLTIVLTSNMI
jgi:hypothetical protein